jgi:hypothetical protein
MKKILFFYLSFLQINTFGQFVKTGQANSILILVNKMNKQKPIHAGEILKIYKRKSIFECQLLTSDSKIPTKINTKNNPWTGMDDEGNNYEVLSSGILANQSENFQKGDIGAIKFSDGWIYYFIVESSGNFKTDVILLFYPYFRLTIDKNKKFKSNWYTYSLGNALEISNYRFSKPNKNLEILTYLNEIK